MSIILGILYTIIGAVIIQVIGAGWYSKKAFGPMWMKLMGKKKAAKTPAAAYLPNLVSSFVYSGFFFTVIKLSPGGGMIENALVATIFVLFFAAPVAFGSYAFEERNKMLFVLYYGYVLVSVVFISALFTLVA